MNLQSLLAAGFDVFVVLAELLLKYVTALAWPATVLVLALAYKRPLIGVLERLRKATGWGATVELDERARELAKDSAEVLEQGAVVPEVAPDDADSADPAVPVQDEPPFKSESTDDSRYVPFPVGLQRNRGRLLVDLLEKFEHDDATWEFKARRAVDSAWLDLTMTMDDLGEALKMPRRQVLFLPKFAVHLGSMGLVSTKTERIAFDLNALHDRLVSRASEDLSVASVIDFVSTAENLREIFNRVLASVRESGYAKGAQQDGGA